MPSANPNTTACFVLSREFKAYLQQLAATRGQTLSGALHDLIKLGADLTDPGAAGVLLNEQYSAIRRVAYQMAKRIIANVPVPDTLDEALAQGWLADADLDFITHESDPNRADSPSE